MARELTDAEAKAVRSLKRLAKTWPESIKIFGWSGNLCIMDAEMEAGASAMLDEVYGIECDGGDPG